LPFVPGVQRLAARSKQSLAVERLAKQAMLARGERTVLIRYLVASGDQDDGQLRARLSPVAAARNRRSPAYRCP
jgi:hypothetical protein